ncbi:PHB depolymerase family esterase [Undibacterium sp.]|uniref:extracellular catalytic domain type 1 short-chain-length polyhydroxyalkanoate depolymerase n=1 Tax=Undibacterium sp. TaxID=1914977 RepID=UPI002731FE84|nr:PHB depolymerase family esterase [Undibacterium sp.]MDP1979184.1 PHB depolymerase family esterase [Undibacterium sp.]
MNFNQDLLARMRMAGQSWRDAQAFAVPVKGSINPEQLQKLTAVTELIQRTLNDHLPGLAKADTHADIHRTRADNAKWEQSLHDINPRPAKKHDVQARGEAAPQADVIDVDTLHTRKSDKSDAGRFISGSYANAHGKRGYKLYVPSSYAGDTRQALPLIVMLHGCTQGPDDFATGTGMNLIAEQQQCIVVYPAQDQGANTSKCWNWFKAMDQKRDQGEPALIAGITREIMADYHVDERRVFIAGMSAGGAMAAIMADAYPELYAAVGIHSGLPFGAANDLPSALAAMRGAASQSKKPSAGAAIPIIVFHGDQDHTVNNKNADHIMTRYLDHSQARSLQAQEENGSGKNGRRYTRTRYAGDVASQPAHAEQWVIHGAGHAWSGGNSQGSYTDASGPDASREMLRFFLSQASNIKPD